MNRRSAGAAANGGAKGEEEGEGETLCSLACRCGAAYVVSAAALQHGERDVACSGCSLVIRVVWDEEHEGGQEGERGRREEEGERGRAERLILNESKSEMRGIRGIAEKTSYLSCTGIRSYIYELTGELGLV